MAVSAFLPLPFSLHVTEMHDDCVATAVRLPGYQGVSVRPRVKQSIYSCIGNCIAALISPSRHQLHLLLQGALSTMAVVSDGREAQVLTG